MGLDEEEVEGVRLAAYLHDIGKIGIPSDILYSSGSLSPGEWQAIREHPLTGERILSPIDFPWQVAAIVGAHHERFDGSGYPRGLAGEDIPIGARIVSVADAYDAMTSDRPYRPALSREQAGAELKHNSGTQFDPRVVDAFLEILESDSDKAA